MQFGSGVSEEIREMSLEVHRKEKIAQRLGGKVDRQHPQVCCLFWFAPKCSNMI